LNGQVGQNPLVTIFGKLCDAITRFDAERFEADRQATNILPNLLPRLGFERVHSLESDGRIRSARRYPIQKKLQNGPSLNHRYHRKHPVLIREKKNCQVPF